MAIEEAARVPWVEVVVGPLLGDSQFSSALVSGPWSLQPHDLLVMANRVVFLRLPIDELVSLASGSDPAARIQTAGHSHKTVVSPVGVLQVN